MLVDEHLVVRYVIEFEKANDGATGLEALADADITVSTVRKTVAVNLSNSGSKVTSVNGM